MHRVPCASSTTPPSQKGFVVGDIDKTTGLTHIGARDYDTKLGQFISVDPLLSLDQPQSLNGYNYANNSPVTNSDPTGERNEECGTLYNCPRGNRITFSNTKEITDRGGDDDPGGKPSVRHSKESNRGGEISKSSKNQNPGPPVVVSPDGNVYSYPAVNTQEFTEIYASNYFKEIADFGRPDDPKLDWDLKIHALIGACQQLVDRGCDPATSIWANAKSTVEVYGFFEGGGIGRPTVGLRGGAKGAKSGAGDCKCFLAGTDVLMADGTTKDIEDIKLGTKSRPPTPRQARAEAARSPASSPQKTTSTSTRCP